MTHSNQQHKHLCTTYYHHCIATLTGHNSYISSITLAGKFLYTGSSEGAILAWKRNPLDYEVNDENLANNEVGSRKGAVKSLIVSANRLFSAHQDNKIRIWEIKTKDPQDNQKYERIATLPTFSDRTLKFLNPNNQVQIRRHKKCTWVHHVDAVSALALSQDGSLLYSASWDRTLKIWQTSDFKCLQSISKAHDDAINAMVSSNSGEIYTGSTDKKIKVWRKTDMENKHVLVNALEKHNSGINALAITSDGSLLYSGSGDRSILAWKKNDNEDCMELLGALRGHTKAVLCLVTVSDLVCSGSSDKTIRIWKEVTGSYSCLAVLEGHMGPVKCLAAAVEGYKKTDTSSSSSSSYLIYSGSLDCDVKVWKVFASPN